MNLIPTPAITPDDLVVTRWGTRFKGRVFPHSIGRAGFVNRADKREGDGATPRGVHHIVGMLYRADRTIRPAPWARAIGPRDLWSDDITDPDYNLHVRAPHPYGHETLCRADPLYDLILITDWNYPIATPGRGSAIFVHQWRRPGFATAGCVAFSRSDLLWIAKRIKLHSRLIVLG